MKLYSYVLDHDFGLAPNPFGGFCTLAVCKTRIRSSRKLKIGDWVVGTGGKKLGVGDAKGKFYGKLIYAMKVSDRILMEDYWYDSRFQYKKPVPNGSLLLMYGDNFYHKGKNGEWIQECSAHSTGGQKNAKKHLKIDTQGKNVLIGEHFYYFGDIAPALPAKPVNGIFLKELIHSGIGFSKKEGELAQAFVQWLESSYEPRIYGDPINWKIHDQRPIQF